VLLAVLILAGCTRGGCDQPAVPGSAKAEVHFPKPATSAEIAALLRDAGWNVTVRERDVLAEREVPDPLHEGIVTTLSLYAVGDARPEAGYTEVRVSTHWSTQDDAEARRLLEPHLGPVRDRFAAALGEPISERYVGTFSGCGVD
jgi:hypothetical protein